MILNQAFGVDWDGDDNHGVSRNAIYDALVGLTLGGLSENNHGSLSAVSTSQHHVKTVANELNLADLNEKNYVSLTNYPVSSTGNIQTNFSGVNNFKLYNMIDPTADQDYCTKKYHDSTPIPAIIKEITGFVALDDFHSCAHATSCSIQGSWVCPYTSASWKVLIIFSSTVSERSKSGLLKVGKMAIGEVYDDNNALSEISDLYAITQNLIYNKVSAAFSLNKGDYVNFKWYNDENNGSGDLHIYHVSLYI